MLLKENIRKKTISRHVPLDQKPQLSHLKLSTDNCVLVHVVLPLKQRRNPGKLKLLLQNFRIETDLSKNKCAIPFREALKS